MYMPRGRKPSMPGKKRGRKSRLATISMTDLQNELRRREGLLNTLMQQRNHLAQHLHQVEMEISMQGGTISGSAEDGRRRGRPPGSGSKSAVAPHRGRRGRKPGGEGSL